MNNPEKEQIKRLDFEKTIISIRETYLDDEGHERERVKNIEVPVFKKLNIDNIEEIVKNICYEIEFLNNGKEFTLQQFINKYNVEDKDKSHLCDLILDYCKKENIIMVLKEPFNTSDSPWNMIRIKEKK